MAVADKTSIVSNDFEPKRANGIIAITTNHVSEQNGDLHVKVQEAIEDGHRSSKPGDPKATVEVDDANHDAKQKAAGETANETANETPLADIIYRLDYRDIAGELLSTKRSQDRIDVESVASMINKAKPNRSKDGRPDPVIEILTEVTSRLTHQRNNRKTPGPQASNSGPPKNQATRPLFMDDDFLGTEQDDGLESLNVSQVGKTYMIIHSTHLVNAIRTVVKYYPGQNLLSKKLVIDEPYQILIHHRKELADYKCNQPPEHSDQFKTETNNHIDILLGFLEKNFGPMLKIEEERHQRDPPVATFEYLWLLFKPGEDVYFLGPGMKIAAILSGFRYDDFGNSVIGSWNLRRKNAILQPHAWRTVIAPFDGEIPIDSLDIYPARFHKENLDQQGGLPLRERQIQLGRLYWRLYKQSYMEYSGPLLDQGGSRHLNGRVIIDEEAFNRFRPKDRLLNSQPPPQPGVPQGAPPPPVNNISQRAMSVPNQSRTGAIPPSNIADFMSSSGATCGCQFCRTTKSKERSVPFMEYRSIDPKRIEPTNEHIYWLCDSSISGYVLSNRSWACLAVSGLKETSTSNSYEYLVLDEDIKTTIESLVWKYESNGGSVVPWSADIVKGKGEGQIFLLHGAPGVGKTCTAECVAELTNRPLLSLTCGDMGTTPQEVENNLDEFLELGELWGAIVLLDEADIYLEQRDTENLTRNALVSVFLRALEYYKGILFLTTNRVGTFDDAFISRIHVSLHYRNLSHSDRVKIWNKNFERLEDEQRSKRIIIAQGAKEYARYDSPVMKEIKWNGREIRNAIQTAVALAEYEAHKDKSDIITLRERHLTAVVNMSKKFKEYIKTTHKNLDSAARARHSELRNDDYGQNESKD